MKIGAWAGYPILGPGGEVLGSTCVIDENPHPWQPAELVSVAVRKSPLVAKLRSPLVAS
jgi:hypothetical protein